MTNTNPKHLTSFPPHALDEHSVNRTDDPSHPASDAYQRRKQLMASGGDKTPQVGQAAKPGQPGQASAKARQAC